LAVTTFCLLRGRYTHFLSFQLNGEGLQRRFVAWRDATLQQAEEQGLRGLNDASIFVRPQV
jgi:hypothetical protein